MFQDVFTKNASFDTRKSPSTYNAKLLFDKKIPKVDSCSVILLNTI